MIARIANNSKEEGRLWSRLPTFSEYWIKKIRGSSDFFGLNYYTSRFIREPVEPIGDNPSVVRDRMIERLIKPEWIQGASKWLYSVPKGLGDILRCFNVLFIFRSIYEFTIRHKNYSCNYSKMDQKRIQ